MSNKNDPINPSHYIGRDGMLSIDVLEQYGFTAHLFTAMKYILRAGNKPGESAIKDLKKSRWFVERAIEKKHIIRTLCFNELPGGSFVAPDAHNPSAFIDQFAIAINLQPGVYSLMSMVQNHGEISDAVLKFNINGINRELDELQRHLDTFGFERGGQPEEPEQVSA